VTADGAHDSARCRAARAPGREEAPPKEVALEAGWSDGRLVGARPADIDILPNPNPNPNQAQAQLPASTQNYITTSSAPIHDYPPDNTCLFNVINRRSDSCHPWGWRPPTVPPSARAGGGG
jgi:hypothetical protein